MIEMNSQCNLQCIHCTREQLKAEGRREPKILHRAELKHILDQLKECPVDTIKVEGLSEPMLNMQIDEQLQTIREYFPKAHIILITNLQYSPDKTKFFQSLKFIDALYISVDGTEKIYERIRKGANYAKFLNALEQIKMNTSPLDLQKIHLNFTATAENFTEIPKIYELKGKYGLSSVRINLVQNWDENQKNTHQFSEPLLDFVKKYNTDVKGVANWNYSDCFWVFNGIVIDVDGNVRQCVLNNTQKPIGNVFRTSLREIFNDSYILNEARNLLPLNKCNSSCTNCDYKGLSPTLAKVFSGLPQTNKPRIALK